jgi:diguanylate cyclase (GGDEF)-like protein
MGAVAARRWWAARRRQVAVQAAVQAGSGLAARIAAPPAGLQTARCSRLTLMILAVAMIGCAVAGCLITQDNARSVEIKQHIALQKAIDEARTVFGDGRRIDGGELRLIEEWSGLRDLHFGADFAPERGRELQSLLDARGRILGWFSWTPHRPRLDIMYWLWALVGAVGTVLVVCALMAGRATQRLARNIETMHKLTREDVLTGLPNQSVVLEKLESVLVERGRAASGQIAFALIDIDGLHEINETLGRQAGNEVLLAVAERFRAVLPVRAELGRFEDDEFAVIAAVSDGSSATVLAEKLSAALSEPVVVEQASSAQICRVSAGIGVALAPDDGTRAEEIARRAALALGAAKQEGHGTVRRFAPQIESELADRRFLLRELKAATAAQAFELHFQPIVAAAGGAIIGVEALLRWNHPTRGAIAPSVFIPLAEQNGLMNELGEFALRRALADAVRWPDLFVTINLSPMQIRDPHFVDLVAAILKQTEIAPSRVVLEITEGVLIDDPQDIQARLEALCALGVHLALDDFGTGYSSLSYLQKFPFHRLKIDRAFVAALGSVGNAGAIIHSIVGLGHALGMIVLAEGVETDQQRVLLRLAGCDEMQGYLFAKPRPAEAIDRIATRSRATREPAPVAALAS